MFPIHDPTPALAVPEPPISGYANTESHLGSHVVVNSFLLNAMEYQSAYLVVRGCVLNEDRNLTECLTQRLAPGFAQYVLAEAGFVG